MKITKSQLRKIIKEEFLAETARELKGDPIEIYGSFAMADLKLDHLSNMFPEDAQTEIIELKKHLQSLRKAVLGV
jgi:ribosomal protein L29